VPAAASVVEAVLGSRASVAGNRKDVGKRVSRQRHPRSAETAHDRWQNTPRRVGKTPQRERRRENHSVGHRGTWNCAAAVTPAVKPARSIAKIPTALGQAMDKSPAPDGGLLTCATSATQLRYALENLREVLAPTRDKSGHVIGGVIPRSTAWVRRSV
jgi:hypothetical protein